MQPLYGPGDLSTDLPSLNFTPTDAGLEQIDSENVGGRAIPKSGFVLDGKGKVVMSSDIVGPVIENVPGGTLHVTDGIGKPRIDARTGLSGFHAGEDEVPMAANGAVRTDATAIMGAQQGTVAYVGPANGFGDHAVVIDLPDGNQLIYGRMADTVDGLSKGDTLNLGDPIGTVGNEGLGYEGSVRGLHLHIEERQGQTPFTGLRLGVDTPGTDRNPSTPTRAPVQNAPVIHQTTANPGLDVMLMLMAGIRGSK